MDMVEKLAKRPQFVSPSNVLERLGLKNGMNVVDYASGAGHWTIAAAKLVAPKGRVLAVEDDINMLNLVLSKAETRHISNIDIEEIELERGTSKLAKPSDLVIVSNILHLIKDKKTFAEKAARMVLPKGRLLFIDWEPKETLFGPPLELRVSKEMVTNIFEKTGLVFQGSVDTGVDHFGLLFENKGDKNE